MIFYMLPWANLIEGVISKNSLFPQSPRVTKCTNVGMREVQSEESYFL